MSAPAKTAAPLLDALRNPRIGAVLLLGFSSGLPLSMTGSTLQAWLTVAGVDIKTIAWFSWIGVPYLLKFLGAPLMDRFVPPFLGRRRGWMLGTQLGLLLGLVGMGLTAPDQSLLLVGTLALWVAFLSASQDIVIDAYRADVLRPPERGMGAAVSVFGYRIAMLVAGGLALIVADAVGWRGCYLFIAALMLVGMAASLRAPEPIAPATPPRTLTEAVVGPLRDLFKRQDAVALLAVIMLYKDRK